MKSTFFLLIFCFSFGFIQRAMATHDPSIIQPVSNTPDEMPDADEPVVYFKANGVDPVWRLSISQSRIDFQTAASGFGTFTAPHVEPVKAMDSNIKIYKLQTDAGQMEIEIAQMLCQNENSRERFPYAVTVSLKQGRDTTFTYFTGCGLFVTDERLEAKWILQELKGDALKALQLNDTVPFLELHARGNSFSGYGGCNELHGRIFSERNLLRFTDIVPTKRSCPAISMETEFIKALQFSTYFEIADDKLILSNPGGVLMTLIKQE